MYTPHITHIHTQIHACTHTHANTFTCTHMPTLNTHVYTHAYTPTHYYCNNMRIHKQQIFTKHTHYTYVYTDVKH